jgi:8-oxo-dGTP pyrophosphatase MutT (NUDIX family)
MKIRRQPHRIVLISGEEIHEAAVREVQEETGILTRFKSIIAFRHIPTNTCHIIQKLKKDTNILNTFRSVMGIRIRRIRTFLDLQDPDPLVSTDPDPSLFS